MVIDSDKDSDASSINNTKARVLGEAKGSGVFVWVTEGREIENYIPEAILHRAIQKVHPGAILASWGKYTDMTIYQAAGPQPKDIDKIRVAREVTNEPPGFCLDLSDQTNRIVSFIRRANLMNQP